MAYTMGNIQDIKDEIFNVLTNHDNLEASHPFVFCGQLPESSNPGLHINDHGIVGLPLSNQDAAAIRAKAKQSPFGHKEKTIVDLNVRKSWELNPSDFSLKNPAWQNVLRTALTACYNGLMLNYGLENVEARLHKLLLYEEGAFFKPHKDSEKAEGMFGTMIVCLPAKHEGGTLVFNHGKRTRTFDTSTSSDFGMSVAAWYADITHDVVPVTSGLRLVLTYNLVKKGAPPVVPKLMSEGVDKHPLKDILSEYNDLLITESDLNSTPFLVHGLEFEYSQAALKASSLKGADAVQLNFLQDICTNLEFELYLATFEREIERDDQEMGYGEYGGYVGYGYGEADENGHELSRSDKLKSVVDLNGHRISDTLRVNADALLDKEFMDEVRAKNVERSGWTGNAGATATFWYRKTALLIVPPVMRKRFAYICAGASIQTIDLFDVSKCNADSHHAKKVEFVRLCAAIIEGQGKNEYGCYGREISYNPNDKQDILFDKAVTAVIDLDRLDLCDRARARKGNQILLRQLDALGRAVVRFGLAPMQDRLLQVSKSSKQIEERISSFQKIKAAMRSAQPPAKKYLIAEYSRWYCGVLVEGNLDQVVSGRGDGEALAKLHNELAQDVFVQKVLSVMEFAPLPAKIGFVNYFTPDVRSGISKMLTEKVKGLMKRVWANFCFSGPGINPLISTTVSIRSIYNIPERRVVSTGEREMRLCGADVFEFLDNAWVDLELTQDLFWHNISTALRSAEPQAVANIVLPFVETVVSQAMSKPKKASMYAEDRPGWRSFIAHALRRCLSEHIGVKPKRPTTWRQDKRGCSRQCQDCTHVNNFLVDPNRQTLDFPCGTERRQHLHSQFTNASNISFSVETIRQGNPHTWRITKDHRATDRQIEAWQTRLDKAKSVLDRLMKSQDVQDLLGDDLSEIVKLRCTITGEARAALRVVNGNTTKSPIQKRKRATEEDGEDAAENKKSKTDALIETHQGIEVIDLT